MLLCAIRIRALPHARIAHGVADVGVVLLVGRRLAETPGPGHGSAQATRRQHEQSRAYSAGCLDRRENERGDHPADRQRRLADSERETALFPREPGHDGAAARCVDAGSRRATDRQCRNEDGKGRRKRGDQESRPAARQSRGENGSLSRTIREQPPAEQRDYGTCVRSCDRQPDLREPEVVLALERGREHRNAEKHRRVRGLGARAEREDRPTVAVHRARGYRQRMLGRLSSIFRRRPPDPERLREEEENRLRAREESRLAQERKSQDQRGIEDASRSLPFGRP
jgi:hypothetical protein